MSHCVPDWDESAAAEFWNDLEVPPRARAPAASSGRTSHHKPVPPASDNDFSELIWTPDGDLVMQVHTGRSLKNTHWLAPGDRDRDRDRSSCRLKDDTLDAVVSSAAAAPPATTFEEDDLISWLQYPDDGAASLDTTKNDCSAIFDEPTTSNVQVFRDPPPVIQPAQAQPVMGEARTDVPVTAAATATTMTAAAPGISSTAPTQWMPATKDSPPLPNASVRTVSTSTTTPMLPPKPQKAAAAGTSLNFSHFSRPAVIARANLHSLSKCSGSISTQLQEQFKKSEVPPPPTTVENSAGSAGTARSAVHQKEAQGQSSDVQQSLGSQSSWPSSLKSPKSKRGQKDNGPSSSAAMETNEQTFTSSDGSGNTTERLKKKTVRVGKRAAEDSMECQSEDAEGESVDVKKRPPARTGGAKRSRAAEVHNLSERRRRDRINEKMKALQELIPNSNKTDKASMLDEAIEYLKMLQLQLQMMSMRSGLSLPPMIIPSGMQHLQMQQMQQMPHVGMGMGMGVGLGVGFGMGMGMGVGLMDVNSAASVRAMMPLQQPSANMPLEMYHAYILHQQQQQQQQMQLQMQQQHQSQQQQQPQPSPAPSPSPPPAQTSDQHKPGGIQ